MPLHAISTLRALEATLARTVLRGEAPPRPGDTPEPPAHIVLRALTAHEGSDADAALAEARDGRLYGIAREGGGPHWGARGGSVFRLERGGALTVLHVFGQGGDAGRHPQAGLIEGRDGAFYGVASEGTHGAACGVVFRIDPAGRYETLHAFGAGEGGEAPMGRLVEGLDGALYGTTNEGGAAGQGCVFRLAPGGGIRLLYSFDGPSGAFPRHGLALGADGHFYGSADEGGAHRRGTLYRLAHDGRFTLLHSFAGGAGDGSSPSSALARSADGALYGTTFGGGAGNRGTIYRLDPASGEAGAVHMFAADGSAGAHPIGGVVCTTRGKLIGTTRFGGAASAGTVYALRPGGAVVLLHSFGTLPGDGREPGSAPLLARDGHLYGVTPLGGSQSARDEGHGTIYRLRLGR